MHAGSLRGRRGRSRLRQPVRRRRDRDAAAADLLPFDRDRRGRHRRSHERSEELHYLTTSASYALSRSFALDLGAGFDIDSAAADAALLLGMTCNFGRAPLRGLSSRR